MNFSFIFIGSTHGFIDDFIKQKEIILSVNPEFVLCEDLEDLILDSKEKFEELFRKKRISDMTSFQEVERLIRLCFNKNIKLIGIDFKNFGFNENLQSKIKNQKKLSLEEESGFNKLLSLREKKHLDKILEYKNKTSLPLVIILGCWHLREGSLLRISLKNYKLIIPCDERGNLLIEPPKDKNIKYKEVISDDNKIKD